MPSKTDDIVRISAPFISGRKTILDIGCGDGALVSHFREIGFDARGIDKKDPKCAFCIECSLEEYSPHIRFDVVTARLALHHTDDLSRAMRCLRDLMADDGVFVAQEFAWEVIDVDAIEWVRKHIDRPGPAPMTIDLHRGDPTGVLKTWHETYGDLHSFAAFKTGAAALFVTIHEEPVPYLSWVLDRPDCLDEERAAIHARRINPIGRICVMTRL